MIPVYLDVSKETKSKINYNIWCMFDLLEATCEGLSYEEILDGIFPPYILDTNLDKCVSVVKELSNMTRDKYEREYLSPFYEWTLYHTILWWLDVADDIVLDEIPREECINKDGLDLYNFINNEEKYIDFLFQDWDFLYVEEMFAIYKRNPKEVEEFFHIDLNEYVDLMPKDIQEEYRRLHQETKEITVVVEEQETYIINSIYNFLQIKMMSAKNYEDVDEVELSDNIKEGLFLLFKEHDLDIERETRAGYAIEDLGELDFFIYSYKNGIYKQVAIGENKQWGAYRDSIGQLLGYMDNNTRFGFTIIYNKDTQLSTVLKGRKRILEEFEIDGDFKVVGKIEELEDMNDVLRTCHENPEVPGTYFNLYHFVFNVYKPQRKRAATVSRSRGRKKEH